MTQPLRLIKLVGDVCSDEKLSADAKYHGIIWDVRVGNDISNLASGDSFTVENFKNTFFDVSRVKDCKGELTHIALNFNGLPALPVPDRLCCNPNRPIEGCGA